MVTRHLDGPSSANGPGILRSRGHSAIRGMNPRSGTHGRVFVMMEGTAFRPPKGTKNHIAIGIDQVPSLCGSAFLQVGNPKTRVLGQRMPLDKLIRAHSNICVRCDQIARVEIEKSV